MSWQDFHRLIDERNTDVTACMAAISGYFSELYADILSGWRVASWTARTRQGVATEYLWMNYSEPQRLHDYRYLGDD